MVCFQGPVAGFHRVEDVLSGVVPPSAALRTNHSVRVQQRAAVRDQHRRPTQTGPIHSRCAAARSLNHVYFVW